MNVLIDIEAPDGTRQGSGPIATASNVRITRRLSKAGTVAFEMPASDPKVALITAKRITRIRSVRANARVDLGAGIVDSITARTRAGDPPTLAISGDDLLSELANRRVLQLVISDGAGGPVPIATALASIMALAPAGWTLDTTSYTASGSTVYHQFGDETVLAALIWVATAVGEEFRLGTGRQVVWLYQQQSPSGLRAVQGGDAVALGQNTQVVLLDSLDEVQDTHATITRVYPYGAGNGTARLTLANATWTPPAGYTIDKVNNFIKVDAADLANRIEDVTTYSSIAPIASGATHGQSAANQLAVAAYQDLRKRSGAVKTYKATVTKVDADLRPGETIRVQYRRTIDGYAAMNVNADLVILEATTSFDVSGIVSVGLTLATVDLWPRTAQSITNEQVAQASARSSIPQKTQSSQTADGLSGLIAPNTVYAGPTSGSPVAPAFRALIGADLPALTSGYPGVLPPASGGTGVANGTNTLTITASGTAALDEISNTFTAVQIMTLSDAATGTSVVPLVVQHATSATPAAGFGAQINLNAQTTSGNVRVTSQLIGTWVNPTDATRQSRLRLMAIGNAAIVEGLRVEGIGTAPGVGFLGAAASVRQTWGAATAAATYGVNEQTMLQRVYDLLRLFGLAS